MLKGVLSYDVDFFAEVEKMLPFDRRQAILKILETKDFVHLDEISNALGDVSISTIRRDLQQLEMNGVVRVLRGGATKIGNETYDRSFEIRDASHIAEKEKIAKCAAGLVKDGDVVYIDSGSTCLRVVKYLKNKKLMIVTSNAMVCNMIQNSDIRCIVTGGELSPTTASLLGPIAEKCLQNMFFDIAFLGASGISVAAGVNTADPMEASKKQIIWSNSSHCYVLADSSKEEIKTFYKAFDIKDANIICDRVIPVLDAAASYIIAQ